MDKTLNADSEPDLTSTATSIYSTLVMLFHIFVMMRLHWILGCPPYQLQLRWCPNHCGWKADAFQEPSYLPQSWSNLLQFQHLYVNLLTFKSRTWMFYMQQWVRLCRSCTKVALQSCRTLELYKCDWSVKFGSSSDLYWAKSRPDSKKAQVYTNFCWKKERAYW